MLWTHFCLGKIKTKTPTKQMLKKKATTTTNNNKKASAQKRKATTKYKKRTNDNNVLIFARPHRSASIRCCYEYTHVSIYRLLMKLKKNNKVRGCNGEENLIKREIGKRKRRRSSGRNLQQKEYGVMPWCRKITFLTS